MPEKALKNVASQYHLTVEQAAEIVRLLESDYSIPYIMRYHKELAATLEPADFYELVDEKRRLDKLEARRRKILKKLQERDILNDSLAEKINLAHDVRELIDYYVPFRPRKRSQSRQALSQGLEPLAREVLTQEHFIPDMGAAAEPFIAADKGLENVEAVLEGVFHIVCDWVAEEKSHRDRQRKVVQDEGEIVVSRAARSIAGRLAREFRGYFEFRQKLNKLHPYHMLTIMRGKRLKALQYHIEPPLAAMERAAAALYLAGGTSQLEQVYSELDPTALSETGESLKKLNSSEFLVACIRNSLTNILASITGREFEKELQKKAEEFSLATIRRNVRAMLMTRPLRQVLLAIHPGYRTGCNLAVLSPVGAVLANTTVYPHQPQNQMAEAREALCALIEQHGVQVVAIGTGTGCEETEDLISALIAEKYPTLQYTIVGEVGLEAFANSRSSRNELPQVPTDERTAAAVGRRLIDPLGELIKINPRELCPEPYADEVNGGTLKTLLDRTIEECVCKVGADANTSHFGILRYICSLGPERALKLIEFREKEGPLANRLQIKNVPGIEEDAYERAIGFIRVASSSNPLDVTRIHPRFYPLAQDICTQLGIAMESLATPEGRSAFAARRADIKLADLEKQYGVHYLLLKDIIDEMADPWPDPRNVNPGPVLRQKRLRMEDLQAEQWLEGTVRNIVDFGAFVDVGVGEDGLVHISELSDRFVESPYDVVAVGDRVRVRVLRVDREKGRIALSMRTESAPREARGGEPRKRRPDRVESRPARQASESVPAARPAGLHAPKSTLGAESRRVQKASMAVDRLKTEQPVPKKEPAEQKAEETASEQKEGPPKEKPAEEIPAGGLLARLDFAKVERRGEHR